MQQPERQLVGTNCTRQLVSRGHRCVAWCPRVAAPVLNDTNWKDDCYAVGKSAVTWLAEWSVRIWQYSATAVVDRLVISPEIHWLLVFVLVTGQWIPVVAMASFIAKQMMGNQLNSVKGNSVLYDSIRYDPTKYWYARSKWSKSWIFSAWFG